MIKDAEGTSVRFVMCVCARSLRAVYIMIGFYDGISLEVV